MTAVSLLAIGAFGLVYSYFLYPLILLLIRDLPPIAPRQAFVPARLSLIIAARNEERRIRDKVEESLRLRQVVADLEILVASDASTDSTDSIVEEYADQGVRLVRTNERRGKEFAQQAAILAASGDVLVFTDTGTTIVAESMSRIVTLFSDPAVGAVSSTDRIITADGTVSGEGLYIRYEMWLRELESRKGGLIGLSGSFFAARRSVCEMWDISIPSDFAVAINCGSMGLRAVSDPEVIGEYRDARDPDHEFARKVRTVIRGMTALAAKCSVLNPLRFPRLSFQLWSHKVLRWAVPWFGFLYIAGAAGMTITDSVNAIFLAPVVALFAMAALGTAQAARRRSLIAAAYFYIQVNAAALMAAVQFMLGKRVTTWVPTTR